MARAAGARPARELKFDLKRLRTVRAFDEIYTAPSFGFHGARDDDHRASAMPVVDRIAVPTLIITAGHDPFVPSRPFRHRKVAGNPQDGQTMHVRSAHT